MVLLALLSVSMAYTQMLPDFDGYLKFAANFKDVSYYYPMAPDPNAPAGSPYSSARKIRDAGILTSICDTYKDACQWHNGEGAATGILAHNSTVNTYIKESIGTIINGSTPDSKYFRFGSTSRNIFLNSYVGWALPVNLIKSQCDNDPTCDAFVMHVDNSYGTLCKFEGSTGCQPHLKLA